MMKKIICFIFACLLILPSYVIASESRELVGVTETPNYLNDNLIVPFDFEYPTDVHNIAREGSYSFSGVTHQNPLYTNKLFVGKTRYSIEVRSTFESYDLNIGAYKKKVGFDKKLGSLNTKTSGSFDFDTDSTSDEVYLKFFAPIKFEGKIN